MTYYEKYSGGVLFLTLLIVAGGLFFGFRRKISSLIDPLTLHLIWCASCISLLVGYAQKYGINGTWAIFFGTFVIYLPALYAFLKAPRRDSTPSPATPAESASTLRFYLICLALALYSSGDFITYALRSSPVEWVLYRFVQLGARNPLQFICKLGAYPFFYYFSFWLIQQRHPRRQLIRLVLLIVIIIDLLSGGRSQLINVITAYGLFLYKSPPANVVQYTRKVNLYGLLAVGLSLTWAILLASLYETDTTFGDGASAIVNRIVAAGDGLEMYLTNHGERYIGSGVFDYIKASFGIFVSNLFKIPTKSIGWQLFELENGVDSAISVGPNFILPLQVIVLGGLFMVPYALLMAYLTARLRSQVFRGPAGRGLSYALAYYCFVPPNDMEFGTMVYISVLFVYGVFLLPFLYVRIRLPRIRVVLR